MASFYVIVTFDLKSASAEDYEKVYAGFKKLGLSREFKGKKTDGSDNTIYMTTTVAGNLSGDTNLAVAASVRTSCAKVLSDNKIKGEIMVFASQSSTWAYTDV